VLSSAPHDTLQSIVSAAAIAAGAPITLVSLVLRRNQLFRAHFALPPDLAAVRADGSAAVVRMPEGRRAR
jgi:hypothetical protein